jgi:alanyl-tRNA synthetase
VAGLVKASHADLETKVKQIVERNRALERELQQLKSKVAGGAGKDLAAGAREVKGIKVLAERLDDGTDAKTLREVVDRMKDKLGTAVIVLGAATEDGKVRLAAGVTADVMARVRAGDVVNAIAERVGGKGGGRPDFAQAGGTEPGALTEALAGVAAWVESRL